MPLEEPGWWYGTADKLIVKLLRRVSRIYGRRVAARLSARSPYRSRLPVVCVGNFTAGGTGKTPFALTVIARLLARGERPAVLTRGYGGRISGPHWIDPARDTATVVGDEPLLLARAAPTLVARDRRAGAIAIETDPRDHTVIVMDDGLQNPALAKDFTIAVVDARRGIGNGEVIPAGPLRAPLDVQIALTDAILVNTPPAATATSDATTPATVPLHASLRRDFPGPVLAGRPEAVGNLAWLTERPLLAFAGIANPDRFFATVERCGGRIIERATFKDHHVFSTADAERLLVRADGLGAALVTTEKDLVRLSARDGAIATLRAATRTLPIVMTLDKPDDRRLDDLLTAALATGGYRARTPRS